MAQRRPDPPPAADDAIPPELRGRPDPAQWLDAAELALCCLPTVGHTVSGGNLPGLAAEARAHHRQRRARVAWARERGVSPESVEWG